MEGTVGGKRYIRVYIYMYNGEEVYIRTHVALKVIGNKRQVQLHK